MNLPVATSDFDAQRFLGTWHIVVTNYGFWKTRHNPTVTYEELPSPLGRRWRDTLHFTQTRWGKERAGKLPGVDTELSPGRFIWRGEGLLSIVKSPWWVMMVDPNNEWAVTYFGRSNVGTAPGLDIYGRQANLSPTLVAEIVAKAKNHPHLTHHCQNLFAPKQSTLDPARYGDTISPLNK